MQTPEYQILNIELKLHGNFFKKIFQNIKCHKTSAGMPEVLTAAAATSIALCTLLASLFGQLAFPHGPRALIWLHLPLSLALSCAAGCAAAAICTLRLFWRTPWQRTAAAVLMAQTLAFLG